VLLKAIKSSLSTKTHQIYAIYM